MLRDPFRFYQVPPPAPTYFGGTLPTVNVRASYPGDYVANAVRRGGSKFLGTALGFMGQPQRDMMELFTGVEQTPSEYFGIENPVGAFVTDAVTDPVNLIGGGALARLARIGTTRASLRNALKLKPTSAPKQVPSPGKFKSEIDWGKWNPDTPKYPELINEYNAIEESTKKAGTWMKNADGSPFKGLPEQFIQQQSSWFKKAFKNPVRERRSDFFSDEILGGQDPKNYFDKNMPIQFNYHSSPNEFDFFDENLFSTGAFGKGIYTTRLPQNMYGKHLYQLYLNANNPQPYSYTRFVTKNGSEVAERVNDPKLVHERTFYQQLEPGRDYFNPAEESTQSLVPFSNYPKSAIGNVGFFDMTNPNIYKSIIALLWLKSKMSLGAIYGGRNYYRDNNRS